MSGVPIVKELRAYQMCDLEAIRAALTRSRSAVYQLPTGGGKTLVAAELARRAVSRGKRVFFLVHRRELVRQAIKTLREVCPGVEIGVEARGFVSIPWALLQVGMVQTLINRSHVASPDFVEIDEAHHVRARTWESVLNRWPNAYRFGMTATPQRLDGKGLLPFFFGN